MARAVWTGMVSFGLVNIPVSLYPATEPKDVRFHLYDRETGRRIRYRRVVDAGPLEVDEPPQAGPPYEQGPWDPQGASEEEPEGMEGDAGAPPAEEPPADDADRPSDIGVATRSSDAGGDVEVAFQDLVRGVEVEPGRAVVLEPEEIERARPQRSRTIDVEEFVDLAAVDPVYFDKSYYLAPRPDETATKPYALLLRALERTGRAGIGRFVLRTKPHLVAIRPTNGVLALETLFFGDEVRSPAALLRGIEETAVGQRELELAAGLVDMLATEWNPSGHADDYREELLRIIAEKTPRSIVRHEPEVVPEGSRLPDLMEALKASVEAVKRQQGAEGSNRRAR
jgi:Ku protein